MRPGMGEHAAQPSTYRFATGQKRPSKQTPEALGRRLLDILVYAKRCRIGGKLTLDDLAETSEVGDWKMPDFRAACAYAAAQGWLIVQGGVLTLTTAGFAAA
jgi:hypothetical protein